MGPDQNPKPNHTRPHSCQATQEVASLSAENRKLRDQLRHREAEFIRVSDESNSFRRQLEGCDAGRKQMALNCPAFSGNRRTHPEVVGNCEVDIGEPCVMQCKKKSARYNETKGALEFGR